MTPNGHLASIRFGYGLRLGEAPPADPIAWLDGQLGAGDPVPPSPDARARLQAREADRTPPPEGMPASTSRRRTIISDDLYAWAERRLSGHQPFRERLVDFWMNHFSVSRRSPIAGLLVGSLEHEAIRPHMTGRFADMLLAVSLHPAMLVYLNNVASAGPRSGAGLRRGRGLNENLAREMLELHTLSRTGGYVQEDVRQLAHILTGHGVNLTGPEAGYVFRPDAHEPGPKRLLGQEVPEGPEGIAAASRILARHPATTHHLARRLATHFCADDPPPDLVQAVAGALGEEGDLGAAARALVRHPAVWEAEPGKFRRPVDHVLGACRALGQADPDLALRGMAGLFQSPWMASQPDGWPDRAEAWMSPEALLRRVEWSYALAGRAAGVDLAAAAEAALGPLARAATVAEMRRAGSVRDALTLLLSSPEFLRR